MMAHFLQSATVAPAGVFSVRAPVAGDMLGNALRSLYDTYRDLPDDQQSLLDRLDLVD